MKRINIVGGSYGYQVISLSKGEVFFAKYLQPDNIREYAETEEEKITFTRDTLAVVEGLHASGHGCKHVRFVRNDRMSEGVKGLGFVKIKPWPKLRVALNCAGVKRVHAPGGFQNALAYRDEIAVPDYSVSGASGWIILKKDVGHYLDALPPLPKDNGELRTIYSEETGYGSPDTFKAVLYGSMYPVTSLTYYDRPRGSRESYNPRNLYAITFDAGSRLVKKIVHVPTDKEVQDCTIRYSSGVQRSTDAKVGTRLPDWAAESWEDPTGVWKMSDCIAGNFPEGADAKLPTLVAWDDLYQRSRSLGGGLESTPAEMPTSWKGIRDAIVQGAKERCDYLCRLMEEKEAKGESHHIDPWYSENAWLHNFEDLVRSAGFRFYDDQPC